jgi:hypothetical protein
VRRFTRSGKVDKNYTKYVQDQIIGARNLYQLSEALLCSSIRPKKSTIPLCLRNGSPMSMDISLMSHLNAKTGLE